MSSMLFPDQSAHCDARAGGRPRCRPRLGPADAQRWRVLPTEAYAGKQDDMHFVSPDIGWYGNGAGKLYRTLDGGESWTKVWERPGRSSAPWASSTRRNGFLGNIGTDYFPTGTDPRPLYRTADGGAIWTPVEAEGIGAVRGICGIDVLAGGRVDPRRRPQSAGRPAMLRSTDGGERWQRARSGRASPA